MKSIRILHTGDLHLGSAMLNMGDKARSRSAELTETFSGIINLAKSEDVDALLIAGDFFETSEPDSKLLDFVSEQFERIKDIKVLIVLGNHDYGLKYSFPSNVYVFGNTVEKVNIGDADIYGVSFCKEQCTSCLPDGFCADDEGRVNILLMHCEIGTSGVYNPITEDTIKGTKMDYIAMGHAHSHNGFNTSGSVTHSYCGIPEGRAFDECGRKGVIVAEIGKGYTEGKFVPVCSREYICKDVDISGAEDNFEIAQMVASKLDGSENAYRISLIGERSTFVDVGFIKGFLEKEFYFTEVVDDSDEKSDGGYTLKNLFMEKCHNENALKYGLSALRGEKVHIE